jgi:hypothetical protein
MEIDREREGGREGWAVCVAEEGNKKGKKAKMVATSYHSPHKAISSHPRINPVSNDSPRSQDFDYVLIIAVWWLLVMLMSLPFLWCCCSVAL